MLRARSFDVDTNEISALTALASASEEGLVFKDTNKTLLGFGAALRMTATIGATRDAQGFADSQQCAANATTIDAAMRQLREIDASQSQLAPVAFLKVPFLATQTSQLIVPRLIVVADTDPESGPSSRAIAVAVDAEPEKIKIPDPQEFGPDGPDSFDLSSVQPHCEFRATISEAIKRIHSGPLEKVVLARQVRVEANSALRCDLIMKRISLLHPSCYQFKIGGFLGASPELVLRIDNSKAELFPLAGTAAHTGNPSVDSKLAGQLKSSSKQLTEHRIVIDEISRTLSSVGTEIQIPAHPSLVTLRNVMHLGTRITATVGATTRFLDVLNLLHPTSAVAGHPRSHALATISDLEGFERGNYAGIVGYLDADGNGVGALGLRSAQVSTNTAVMAAGVGVVKASDPEDELLETQLKLQAMLAAIVRP